MNIHPINYERVQARRCGRGKIYQRAAPFKVRLYLLTMANMNIRRNRTQRIVSAFFALTVLLCHQGISFQIANTANLIQNSSFEMNGQPTLQSWAADTVLGKLVQDAPPGGGEWSLQLSPGWFPQEGFARTYIAGQSGVGVYQLNAWIKNLNGPRSSSIRVGQWSNNAWVSLKEIPCDSSAWMQYSLTDTLSLLPGDTIAVHLSAGETELVAGGVLFDLVRLEKIQSITRAAENNAQLPARFVLNQNYPNPFNPATVISYDVPAGGFVSLKIFDVVGREMATVVNGRQEAGEHSVHF